MAAVAAMLATGCDAEEGGRQDAGLASSGGGKADDVDDGGNASLGTTEIKLTISADLGSERQGEVVDYEVYVNGRAVPVNEWVEVEYTGSDCVSVVSKNPAVTESGQASEFVTESCAYDFTPDPEFLEHLVFLQMVNFDLNLETDVDVDFGWGFDRIGLTGDFIVSSEDNEAVTVGQGFTYLMVPGAYKLALGQYEPLEAPEDWQTLDVFLDEVSDYTKGFALDRDPRTQIFVEAPAESSSLPAARAKSGCALDTQVWVTWDAGQTTYSRDLGEDQILNFMPYPGPRYSLRVGGLVVEDAWRSDSGVPFYDGWIPTFTHDVQRGPPTSTGGSVTRAARSPTSVSFGSPRRAATRSSSMRTRAPTSAR